MTMNDEYLILGKRNCEIQIMDFTTGDILKTTQELVGETVRSAAFVCEQWILPFHLPLTSPQVMMNHPDGYGACIVWKYVCGY